MRYTKHWPTKFSLCYHTISCVGFYFLFTSLSIYALLTSILSFWRWLFTAHTHIPFAWFTLSLATLCSYLYLRLSRSLLLLLCIVFHSVYLLLTFASVSLALFPFLHSLFMPIVWGCLLALMKIFFVSLQTFRLDLEMMFCMIFHIKYD